MYIFHFRCVNYEIEINGYGHQYMTVSMTKRKNAMVLTCCTIYVSTFGVRFKAIFTNVKIIAAYTLSAAFKLSSQKFLQRRSNDYVRTVINIKLLKNRTPIHNVLAQKPESGFIIVLPFVVISLKFVISHV